MTAFATASSRLATTSRSHSCPHRQIVLAGELRLISRTSAWRSAATCENLTAHLRAVGPSFDRVDLWFFQSLSLSLSLSLR